MRLTVLSGGIGGARFLSGLLDALPGEPGNHTITVIGNTADDIWMFGLKICPDLDTVMYTLGNGIDRERGWGRQRETWNAKSELAAYGVEPTWFGLGDRDLATHIVRSQMLGAGYSLSEVTAALCARWQPGVTLLPMSDDRVETHVVIDADPADPEAQHGRKAVHFQEYWVRLHAPAAYAVIPVGAEQSTPAPGVLEAIEQADVVILPPSNPVVSVGTILAVPGIADAVRATSAPVVGVSPIIGGSPVRGMADKLLPVIGVEVTARAVGEHYGARAHGGLLDGWLVDEADAADVPVLEQTGLRVAARPLYMSDPDATRTLARDTLALALPEHVA
ncbi:MAG: 2-phospho-L-lactate transferase [Nocardioidaceae bacterium]